jgi:hypothetical protein
VLFVTGSSGMLSLSLAAAVSSFIQAKEVKTQEERWKEETVKAEKYYFRQEFWHVEIHFSELKFILDNMVATHLTAPKD